MGDGYQEVQEVISIHAPTRGATFQSVPFIDSKRFQSTLPREERQIHIQFFLSKTPYFNPRSHERSDSNNRWICGTLSISIHAPTRGATVFHFHYPLILSISIHAPTRGATSALCVLLYPPEFQSTLPREERPHSSSLTSQLHNFNPRSHERSDL